MEDLLRSSCLDFIVVSCVVLVDSSSLSDAKLHVDSARDGTLCRNELVDMFAICVVVLPLAVISASIPARQGY